MTRPYYVTWTAQKNALMFPVERSESCFFISPEGQKILDLSSTSFQSSFGHSFKPIQEAMIRQIETMPIASPKAEFDLKSEVAKSLLSFLKVKNGKIFFTQSGAESIENALKMVREFSGKKIVVSRADSYHGASLGALSITGDWRRDAHATVDEWNVMIPSPLVDPDFSAAKKILETAGPEKIAALFFETVSGTNGAVAGSVKWWQAMNDFREQHKILLVLDEVLCGFYRTGAPMAFHAFQQNPDLVCMAKAITGGYFPFGAIWTSQKISDFYEDKVLSCGLTNYAHPVGLAATQAVLETLADPNFVKNISVLIEKFKTHLAELKNLSSVKEIRCHGLLACVETHQDLQNKKFLDAGLYVINKARELFLGPSFVMTPTELADGMERIKKILT